MYFGTVKQSSDSDLSRESVAHPKGISILRELRSCEGHGWPLERVARPVTPNPPGRTREITCPHASKHVGLGSEPELLRSVGPASLRDEKRRGSRGSATICLVVWTYPLSVFHQFSFRPDSRITTPCYYYAREVPWDWYPRLTWLRTPHGVRCHSDPLMSSRRLKIGTKRHWFDPAKQNQTFTGFVRTASSQRESRESAYRDRCGYPVVRDRP